MGIKNFSQFLRQVCGDAYEQMELNVFSGHIIAIDTSYFMYTGMSNAIKAELAVTDLRKGNPDRSRIIDRWFQYFINFIKRIADYKINPVFIKDGTPPDEKKRIKDLRKKKQDDFTLIIDGLRRQIDEMIHKNPNIDTSDLENDLAKYIKQHVSISTEEREYLYSLLEQLGLPVIGAIGEAEQLCSHLCIDRKVTAVVTRDTDVFAYGCPIVITNLIISDNPYFKSEKVEAVLLQNILDILNLTQEQFLDLCILCGTDFNLNIPKIGPVRSYNYIRKYGTIEKVIEVLRHKHDISVLNHIRSRELFTERLQEVKDIELIPRTPIDIYDLFSKTFTGQSFVKMAGLVNSLNKVFNKNVQHFTDRNSYFKVEIILV